LNRAPIVEGAGRALVVGLIGRRVLALRAARSPSNLAESRSQLGAVV
jgi:hypothetical protein